MLSPTKHQTICRPAAREMICVMALTTAYAIGVYFLPQAGLAIHSDVSWIYRLQVADPAAIGSVPDGLATFGGAPMSLLDACKAHYAAFGRLNCLDVASLRAIAAVAGGSANGWLAIYLATGLGMLALLYWLMRALGLPVALAAVLLGGALVAPQEVWLGYRTSEPKNAVALLLALVALILLPPRWRHIAAAGCMAVALQLKEPMAAYWPFVWLVGFGVEARSVGGLRQAFQPKNLWTITWPYLVVGALLVCYVAYMRSFVENRFSYATLHTSGYPDLGPFLQTYWTGLAPALLEPAFATAIPLLLAVLAGVVAVSRDRRQAWMNGMRDPLVLAILIGSLTGVAAHAAFYYATNRVIGDTRYINPANVTFLLSLTALLSPLARAAGPTASRVAILAGLAPAAWTVVRTTPGDTATEGLLILMVCGVGLGVLAAGLLEGGLRRLPLTTAGVLVAVLLTATTLPHLRESLHSAAQNRVEMRAWKALQDTVMALPSGSTVHLRTDTPLMIETVWGLQTEMLFVGRDDLSLLMQPLDTSYYDRENGLVRAAVTAFNAGRPAAKGDRAFVLLLDRGGQANPQSDTAHSRASWIAQFLGDPPAFFEKAYVEGRAASLRFTWDIGPFDY